MANHYYISDNPQPIPTLLSSEVMDKVSTRLQQWRDLANNTKGKMLFVDEANSTGNGDDFGVSDSFAATLYLIDFFFTGLENGVSNVDIR